MPHVVNGIGTWYWGKSDIHGVKGICEACGRSGELLSYDTRTFIVVFFVPIIPLGRKRILEQCPSCKRHNVVKYKVWQQMKNVGLPAAIEAFRASPHDREKAMESIQISVGCQDAQALDEVTAIAAPSFANDAEMQGTIGEAHAYFSKYEQAEEAFRLSLAAQEDADVRNALSRNLLFQSRPDEAWELIAHDLKESSDMRGGLALLIAESYQTWGMHDAAQTVLDATIAALPNLESDKGYKRLRKSATKHQGTDKKLKPKLLAPPKNVNSKTRNWSGAVPIAIAAVVVLGVIGIFCYASWDAAAHREVHLVNGLTIPYRVLINGDQRNLRPMSRTVVEVPEGDINVSIPDETVSIPGQTITIRSSFFTRLFDDNVHVINPDQTAIILWEETEYSQRSDPDAEYLYTYHCGEFFQTYTDVDYPFKEFPDTISMKSGTSIRKSKVEFLQDVAVSSALGILFTEVGSEQAVEFLERKAALDADDSMTVGSAVMFLPEDKSVPLLEKLCSARPIRVSAHQCYQWLMGRIQPEKNLVAEYRDLLAEKPDSSARMYLLGCVETDFKKSELLLQRATLADPPSANAYSALAGHRKSMGKFEDAYELLKKAIALSPKEQRIQAHYMSMLSATGRFEEAIKAYHKVDSLVFRGERYDLYFKCRLGDRAKLDAYVKGIANRPENQDDPEYHKELQAIAECYWAYSEGDIANAITACKAIGDPEMELACAIMDGNLQAAAGMLAENPSLETQFFLLASILLREAGDVENADQIEAVALEQLTEQGVEERQLVDWLSGKVKPDVDEVLRINLGSSLKSVALVALAKRQPDGRGRFLTLAEKLNYDQRFPYLTLKDLIESTSNASAPVGTE
ncbi:MAG: hypothetical protein DHS20C16_12970 [Phycisphaerae bacterium]|nr:MAG: hypothetical protein DHS20C16_12970 [Phycisphaerae bacterium]